MNLCYKRQTKFAIITCLIIFTFIFTLTGLSYRYSNNRELVLNNNKDNVNDDINNFKEKIELEEAERHQFEMNKQKEDNEKEINELTSKLENEFRIEKEKLESEKNELEEKIKEEENAQKLYDELSDEDKEFRKIESFIEQDSQKDKLLEARQEYFKNVFQNIQTFKPSISPLKEYLEAGKLKARDSNKFNEPYLTKDELNKHLKITPEAVENLKFNHENFINSLTNEYPNNIYQEGISGIVFVGGAKFSWLTMLSIMNIRQHGCELPIEVLIPSMNEYQYEICSIGFPKFNARCIFLPKLVGKEINEFYKFKGYQFKSLAISLSSFENVMLIDADNTPLINPEIIFNSKLFKEIGLITWPDFWKRTTNPKFYDIIGKEINDNDISKRRDFGYKEYGNIFKSICPKDIIPFHHFEGTLPDPTSESGQFFINKRNHYKSMILTLYYNSYGPDYYYPLLSQGAAGEGDKETFIASAHALNEKYYNVKKRLISIGRMKEGKFNANAMGQFNPVQDYKISEKYKESNEEVNEIPDLFMLHSNNPKLNPWQLYIKEYIYDKSSGKRYRMYGEDFPHRVKYDHELRTWLNMEKLLCEDDFKFGVFQSEGVSNDEVCHEVRNQIKFLETV